MINMLNMLKLAVFLSLIILSSAIQCSLRVKENGNLVVDVDQKVEKHTCLMKNQEKDIIGCFFKLPKVYSCEFKGCMFLSYPIIL